MHRELPSVKGIRIPLCNIGDVEGGEHIRDRDGTVFQGPGLVTKTVRNHMGRRGSDNVRSLECSGAGKSPTTRSSPAAWDCCVGSDNSQEGNRLEKPFARPGGCS